MTAIDIRAPAASAGSGTAPADAGNARKFLVDPQTGRYVKRADAASDKIYPVVDSSGRRLGMFRRSEGLGDEFSPAGQKPPGAWETGRNFFRSMAQGAFGVASVPGNISRLMGGGGETADWADKKIEDIQKSKPLRTIATESRSIFGENDGGRKLPLQRLVWLSGGALPWMLGFGAANRAVGAGIGAAQKAVGAAETGAPVVAGAATAIGMVPPTTGGEAYQRARAEGKTHEKAVSMAREAFTVAGVGHAITGGFLGSRLSPRTTGSDIYKRARADGRSHNDAVGIARKSRPPNVFGLTTPQVEGLAELFEGAVEEYAVQQALRDSDLPSIGDAAILEGLGGYGAGRVASAFSRRGAGETKAPAKAQAAAGDRERKSVFDHLERMQAERDGGVRMWKESPHSEEVEDFDADYQWRRFEGDVVAAEVERDAERGGDAAAAKKGASEKWRAAVRLARGGDDLDAATGLPIADFAARAGLPSARAEELAANPAAANQFVREIIGNAARARELVGERGEGGAAIEVWKALRDPRGRWESETGRIFRSRIAENDPNLAALLHFPGRVEEGDIATIARREVEAAAQFRRGAADAGIDVLSMWRDAAQEAEKYALGGAQDEVARRLAGIDHEVKSISPEYRQARAAGETPAAAAHRITPDQQTRVADSPMIDELAGGALTGGRDAVFDPADLIVDAAAYQTKGRADSNTGEVVPIKAKFDSDLAGHIFVHQRSDGKQYVASGHHRVALARRAKAEGVDARLRGLVFRESDGWSVGDMVALAARQNIADRQGDAVDYARLLRSEAGAKLRADSDTIDARRDRAGDSMWKDAEALAGLGDKAFDLVVSGVVSEKYAAELGAIARLKGDALSADSQFEILKRWSDSGRSPSSRLDARRKAEEFALAGIEQGEQTELLWGESESNATFISDTMADIRGALDNLLARGRARGKGIAAADEERDEVVAAADDSPAAMAAAKEAAESQAARQTRAAEFLKIHGERGGSDFRQMLRAQAKREVAGKQTRADSVQALREFIGDEVEVFGEAALRIDLGEWRGGEGRAQSLAALAKMEARAAELRAQKKAGGDEGRRAETNDKELAAIERRHKRLREALESDEAGDDGAPQDGGGGFFAAFVGGSQRADKYPDRIDVDMAGAPRARLLASPRAGDAAVFGEAVDSRDVADWQTRQAGAADFRISWIDGGELAVGANGARIPVARGEEGLRRALAIWADDGATVGAQSDEATAAARAASPDGDIAADIATAAATATAENEKPTEAEIEAAIADAASERAEVFAAALRRSGRRVGLVEQGGVFLEVGAGGGAFATAGAAAAKDDDKRAIRAMFEVARAAAAFGYNGRVILGQRFLGEHSQAVGFTRSRRDGEKAIVMLALEAADEAGERFAVDAKSVFAHEWVHAALATAWPAMPQRERETLHEFARETLDPKRDGFDAELAASVRESIRLARGDPRGDDAPLAFEIEEALAYLFQRYVREGAPSPPAFGRFQGFLRALGAGLRGRRAYSLSPAREAAERVMGDITGGRFADIARRASGGEARTDEGEGAGAFAVAPPKEALDESGKYDHHRDPRLRGKRYSGRDFFWGGAADFGGDFRIGREALRPQMEGGSFKTKSNAVFFTDDEDFARIHSAKQSDGGIVKRALLAINNPLIDDMGQFKFDDLVAVVEAAKGAKTASEKKKARVATMEMIDNKEADDWIPAFDWRLLDGEEGRRAVSKMNELGYDSTFIAENEEGFPNVLSIAVFDSRSIIDAETGEQMSAAGGVFAAGRRTSLPVFEELAGRETINLAQAIEAINAAYKQTKGTTNQRRAVATQIAERVFEAAGEKKMKGAVFANRAATHFGEMKVLMREKVFDNQFFPNASVLDLALYHEDIDVLGGHHEGNMAYVRIEKLTETGERNAYTANLQEEYEVMPTKPTNKEATDAYVLLNQGIGRVARIRRYAGETLRELSRLGFDSLFVARGATMAGVQWEHSNDVITNDNIAERTAVWERMRAQADKAVIGGEIKDEDGDDLVVIGKPDGAGYVEAVWKEVFIDATLDAENRDREIAELADTRAKKSVERVFTEKHRSFAANDADILEHFERASAEEFRRVWIPIQRETIFEDLEKRYPSDGLVLSGRLLPMGVRDDEFHGLRVRAPVYSIPINTPKPKIGSFPLSASEKPLFDMYERDYPKAFLAAGASVEPVERHGAGWWKVSIPSRLRSAPVGAFAVGARAAGDGEKRGGLFSAGGERRVSLPVIERIGMMEGVNLPQAIEQINREHRQGKGTTNTRRAVASRIAKSVFAGAGEKTMSGADFAEVAAARFGDVEVETENKALAESGERGIAIALRYGRADGASDDRGGDLGVATFAVRDDGGLWANDTRATTAGATPRGIGERARMIRYAREVHRWAAARGDPVMYWRAETGATAGGDAATGRSALPRAFADDGAVVSQIEQGGDAWWKIEVDPRAARRPVGAFAVGGDAALRRARIETLERLPESGAIKRGRIEAAMPSAKGGVKASAERAFMARVLESFGDAKSIDAGELRAAAQQRMPALTRHKEDARFGNHYGGWADDAEIYDVVYRPDNFSVRGDAAFHHGGTFGHVRREDSADAKTRMLANIQSVHGQAANPELSASGDADTIAARHALNEWMRITLTAELNAAKREGFERVWIPKGSLTAGIQWNHHTLAGRERDMDEIFAEHPEYHWAAAAAGEDAIIDRQVFRVLKNDGVAVEMVLAGSETNYKDAFESFGSTTASDTISFEFEFEGEEMDRTPDNARSLRLHFDRFDSDSPVVSLDLFADRFGGAAAKLRDELTAFARDLTPFLRADYKQRNDMRFSLPRELHLLHKVKDDNERATKAAAVREKIKAIHDELQSDSNWWGRQKHDRRRVSDAMLELGNTYNARKVGRHSPYLYEKHGLNIDRTAAEKTRIVTRADGALYDALRDYLTPHGLSDEEFRGKDETLRRERRDEILIEAARESFLVLADPEIDENFRAYQNAIGGIRDAKRNQAEGERGLGEHLRARRQAGRAAIRVGENKGLHIPTMMTFEIREQGVRLMARDHENVPTRWRELYAEAQEQMKTALMKGDIAGQDNPMIGSGYVVDTANFDSPSFYRDEDIEAKPIPHFLRAQKTDSSRPKNRTIASPAVWNQYEHEWGNVAKKIIGKRPRQVDDRHGEQLWEIDLSGFADRGDGVFAVRRRSVPPPSGALDLTETPLSDDKRRARIARDAPETAGNWWRTRYGDDYDDMGTIDDRHLQRFFAERIWRDRDDGDAPPRGSVFDRYAFGLSDRDWVELVDTMRAQWEGTERADGGLDLSGPGGVFSIATAAAADRLPRDVAVAVRLHLADDGSFSLPPAAVFDVDAAAGAFAVAGLSPPHDEQAAEIDAAARRVAAADKKYSAKNAAFHRLPQRSSPESEAAWKETMSALEQLHQARKVESDLLAAAPPAVKKALEMRAFEAKRRGEGQGGLFAVGSRQARILPGANPFVARVVGIDEIQELTAAAVADWHNRRETGRMESREGLARAGGEHLFDHSFAPMMNAAFGHFARMGVIVDGGEELFADQPVGKWVVAKAPFERQPKAKTFVFDGAEMMRDHFELRAFQWRRKGAKVRLGELDLTTPEAEGKGGLFAVARKYKEKEAKAKVSFGKQYREGGGEPTDEAVMNIDIFVDGKNIGRIEKIVGGEINEWGNDYQLEDKIGLLSESSLSAMKKSLSEKLQSFYAKKARLKAAKITGKGLMEMVARGDYAGVGNALLRNSEDEADFESDEDSSERLGRDYEADNKRAQKILGVDANRAHEFLTTGL